MRNITGRGAAFVVAWLLPVGLWAQAARVAGVVESTSGGFKFPDGTIQETAAGQYANVVVVAKSGGDFTSIQAALDSISDAAADNRYLVRIGPGVFSEEVTTKDYVDLEGSGAMVTKITWTGFHMAGATLSCASDSEIRDLSVVNTGGDNQAKAISCTGARLLRVRARALGATSQSQAVVATGGSLSQVVAVAEGSADVNLVVALMGVDVALEDVKATATGGISTTGVHILYGTGVTELRRVVASGKGGSSENRGIFFESSASLVDSIFTATGAGATNYGGHIQQALEITVRRSELAASGGVADYGLYTDFMLAQLVKINHSRIVGATATLRLVTDTAAFVGASQLDGGPVDTSNGGSAACVLTYDGGFATLSPACLEDTT